MKWPARDSFCLYRMKMKINVSKILIYKMTDKRKFIMQNREEYETRSYSSLFLIIYIVLCVHFILTTAHPLVSFIRQSFSPAALSHTDRSGFLPMPLPVLRKAPEKQLHLFRKRSTDLSADPRSILCPDHTPADRSKRSDHCICDVL